MKKFVTAVVLVLAVVVSCFALAGCTSGEYNYDLPKKVVIGYDPAFPPMGFKDTASNTVIGFDLDLADALFGKMGIEYEFKGIDWDTKEEDLKNGKIDCIWNGYSMSSDRLMQVDFTIPYLENMQVVAVRYDSPYRTIADLADKTLIYQTGSSAKGVIDGNDTLKNNKTLDFENYEMCFQAFDGDRGEAIVGDKVYMDYKISISPAESYRVLPETLMSERYAIGVRKTDCAFRVAINDALLDLGRDGTLWSIAEKWGVTDLLYYGVKAGN